MNHRNGQSLPHTAPSATSIRQIRILAGATQHELGRLVGVTQPTICRWEHGKPPRGWVARTQLNHVLGQFLLKTLAEF
jgi:DNA-binding XRE family transcriptional regulator